MVSFCNVKKLNIKKTNNPVKNWSVKMTVVSFMASAIMDSTRHEFPTIKQALSTIRHLLLPLRCNCHYCSFGTVFCDGHGVSHRCHSW